MTEREKLVKKLTNKGFCFTFENVESLADWVLEDRKRIVEPLAREDLFKYDNAPFLAIRKTLENAGINER